VSVEVQVTGGILQVEVPYGLGKGSPHVRVHMQEKAHQDT